MPALPQNWGRYLATVPQEDLDTEGADAQAALKWVQQYDPSAKYAAGLAASGQAGSFLQYDNSKLPVNSIGQHGMMGLQNLEGLKDQQNYAGPAPWVDQVFGRVGSSAFPIRDKGTWLDVVGPMIVGGFAGLGGGGFNFLSSLAQKLPQVGSMVSGALSGPQQFTPEQLRVMQMMQFGRNGMGGPNG